jgi:small-conductance mechanosensitive channel
MQENIWLSTSDVLMASLVEVWQGVAGFIPNFVFAVVVVILGWLIGAALSKVIAQIIKSVKLDGALRSAGVEELLGKAGIKLNSGVFLGELVKWFAIVVSVIAAFDALKLPQVTNFLGLIVASYIPQVIAAVLILVIAALIAEALRKTVVSAAKAADIRSANFLGSVTKWVIWIFGALAALYQLEIGAIFIQTLFTGVVVAISLALGLSFGLGGKEVAADVLAKARREMSDKD